MTGIPRIEPQRARSMLAVAAALLLPACHLLFPFDVAEPQVDPDQGFADLEAHDDALVAHDDTLVATDTTPLVDSRADAHPPGPVVFSNALSGPDSAQNSGTAISEDFHPGWRFEVPADRTLHADKIGIHAKGTATTAIYGVLVSLSGPSDNPDKLDLTGPDVLAKTLIPLPALSQLSKNASGPVNSVLAPGWYAVVFGTGQLGTKNLGVALKHNTPLPGVQPPFLIKQSANSILSCPPSVRLFVEGILK